MKVLIPQDIAQAGKDYLLSRGYEIKMGSSVAPEVMGEEIRDCDALLIRTAKVPSSVLQAGKQLKVVSKHGVGVDNIDVDAATELGIQVTNGPLSNAESVAEHTVALIMAVAHHLVEMDQNVRAGNWEARDQVRLTGLSGKTVGIVGLGRIGQYVAKKVALGLDMKVIAFDAFLPPDMVPEYVEMAESLQDLCRRSDFVTLHCPATPATKGSINRTCFDQMKSSAFLINCARGEIVNESDLVEALTSGEIAGAGLDVLSAEPPRKNDPLLSLKNVILSPHCGAHSYESFDNMAVHAAMGIDEVLSNKAVTWPVNTPKPRL